MTNQFHNQYNPPGVLPSDMDDASVLHKSSGDTGDSMHQVNQYPTPEAYHADHKRVSNSMLKCFANSRRVFEGKYVTGEAPPETSTKSQGIGTLTHADLLGEGDTSRFVTSPFDSFRTKDAKDWRDEQLNLGNQIVTGQELADVSKCVASVRSKIGVWLDHEGGQSETYETWHHTQSGLDCRAMIDYRIITPKKVVVLDLKTAADESPDGFRRACEQFDYPIQEAHYTAGLEANHGKPVEWLWVVVRNNWPFTCRVYVLDSETQHKAVKARESRLADLAECYRTGDWSEPGEDAIETIFCRDYYLKGEIK